jgi:ATP-dependent DNA helicase DinG
MTTSMYAELEAMLGPYGPIALALGEYEHRPSQIEMARTVWRAIEEEKVALIEAGTGTGKSIAYLVPALISGKSLIVSTANKALQRQLYERDVPLVRDALGLDCESVLIKGRQNYVCLRKYQLELPQQRLFAEMDKIQVYDLDALESWVSTTDTGDLEELGFVLDPDMLANMTCPADECLHRDCVHYDDCFVMRVRQRAAEAQVVITNHHLLITDLQLRAIGGVTLPDSDLIVCDEAHQLEDVATSIFETTLTDYTVPSLLLRRLLRQHAAPSDLDEIAAHNRVFFEGVRAQMRESVAKLEGDWEEGIRLGHSLRDLAAKLGALHPFGDDPDADEENTSLGLALQAVRAAGDHTLTVSRSARDGEIIRYAEQTRQRRVSLILHATPISAAESLSKHLFAEKTVICTSATLSTGGEFGLFRSRCGIHDPPLELIGAPAFDFASQARIYLPSLAAYDWGNREGYFDAVAEEIRRLLEVSRGRAFCLFTSWSGLQYVSNKLRNYLPWPILQQGELPRSELLRRFRETRHSVLFGTKSFWEGVDVPGEALSMVVIDKLPFPSPRDPLHEARTERIVEEGGNPFIEYTLPLMILSLKQGFGRLIRAKTDRGVVAILDSRLSTKRYGETVLRSLPPAQTTRHFGDVYRFFRTGHLDADYALTVWSEPASDAAGYRWHLTRLPDGRIRVGEGVGNGQYRARWHGAIEALQSLRDAIHRGDRACSEFTLEVRFPGVAGDAQSVIQDTPPQLNALLERFGAVRVLQLEGAGDE